MEAGLVQILEGALLAAGEPLSLQRMAILFEEDERPSTEELRSAIKIVGERCEDRGYELVQVASGYRFQVRQNLSDWVARLWQERPARYSRALMEMRRSIVPAERIAQGIDSLSIEVDGARVFDWIVSFIRSGTLASPVV